MEIKTLNEIKDGCTKSKNGWIKHADLNDESNLESLKKRFIALAVKRNILLEEQAASLALKNGSWTEANQRDLDSSEAYFRRIQESYDKAIDIQKKYIKDDLDQIILKVANLRVKKQRAIGKTAEQWADELSYERYILSLFYKDKKLTERVWDDEELEMLEEEQVSSALKSYNEFKDSINDDSIKELACSGFCQNIFYAAGSSYDFFGKPVLQMSGLQQRICILLKNYSNIISNINGKVPDSTLSDWRELEKWAKSSEKAREELEKGWSGQNNLNKINHESIKRASMVEGKDEGKAIQTLLS